MAGPTGDKIIRLNMTDQSVTIEDFPGTVEAPGWSRALGEDLAQRVRPEM